MTDIPAHSTETPQKLMPPVDPSPQVSGVSETRNSGFTGEQIERTASAARRAYGSAGASYGGSAEAGTYRVIEREREFDAWLAAVIAHAKREEQVRIENHIHNARTVAQAVPPMISGDSRLDAEYARGYDTALDLALYYVAGPEATNEPR